MRLIVLVVRTVAGEGEMFHFTETKEQIIDEFSTIVRIQTQQWVRQLMTQISDGSTDRLLGFVGQAKTIRPASGV